MKARNEFTRDKIGNKAWKEYCRYYFAAMAMEGILANSKLCSPKNFDRSCMCDDAITMADELLKQLDQ